MMVNENDKTKSTIKWWILFYGGVIISFARTFFERE